MTDKILETLKEKYRLEELDTKGFSKLKANGMNFNIEAYYARGLGHVSIMKAQGFFGLMKMDTLIIVPKEKDLPLYSYDRIYAMGNDTLIVELYDTQINKNDLSSLEDIKKEYSDLSERDPGEHWYDSIKLSESISKKAKKNDSSRFDELTIKHFKAYLNVEADIVNDKDKKLELSNNYVDGLLNQGGPSTDVFIKKFSKEKTTQLFKEVLFGTGL
ncbi:MAG: hypothetical protein Q4B60_08405 [Erysipelotrichaceae bacterium]|nr:hypothetical protein [Erysipelotrichaceae bacterium]